MEWKKIVKVLRTPAIIFIIMLAVALVSLFLNPMSVMALWMLVTPIVSLPLFLYAGYSAVKNYKLSLTDAFLTGAFAAFIYSVIGAVITIAALIVGVATEPTSAGPVTGTDLATFSAIYLFIFIFGTVQAMFFGAVLGAVGGSITKQKHALPIAAFAVILLYLFIVYLGMEPAPKYESCKFNPGIECIGYKLHANTGELDLRIGQGTGKTIDITGVTCTQNSSSNYASMTSIRNYESNPIMMTSGSMENISESGSSHVVICTDAGGSLPKNTNAGTQYFGKIYIKYTELDTNLTRIVVGSLETHYGN